MVVVVTAQVDLDHTRRTLEEARKKNPKLPVILTFDGANFDFDQLKALNADDYHDARSGEAMLQHRISSCLHRSEVSGKRDAARLAEEECAVWSSLFNSAGTGLLKGRASKFLKHQQMMAEAPLPKGQLAKEAIMACLRDIEWELNNERAKQLLNLTDPVALSDGFIRNLMPIDADALCEAMVQMDDTSPAMQGEFAFDAGNGREYYLSLEITTPSNLDDVLLLTLMDITHKFQLEEKLRSHVHLLEARVEQRTNAIKLVNQELKEESRQRQRMTKQVRESLAHITKGVIGAKRILEVALTGKEELHRVFPDSMLIERPMDILGGDFLFAAIHEGKRTLALIDSTGHGIPGAMVSLMGSSLINKAFVSLDNPNPASILESFHMEFGKRMSVGKGTPHMYGYDAGILTLDEQQNTLEFAGARGDLYLIRDGKAQIFRGTRCSIELPIAGAARPNSLSYTLHSIPIQKDDQVYMITDGVRDQFGGEHNRKLGRKRFADILAKHAALGTFERERAIQQDLLIWKGANTKVDDATLVGIQF